MKDFSVVVPTYTGVNTVGQTLDSILEQRPVKTNYEVVVVIDGPNKPLREAIDAKAVAFKARKTPFKIKQLSKNRGRFEARIAGAKAANFDQLLFVDDRVHLAKNYFMILESMDENIAMANVAEVDIKQTSVISQTMFLIRRRLYGDKFGRDFNDYYINKANFESSPKGTTSIWIAKDIFLNACKAVSNRGGEPDRYVNEDTKILRAVVDSGHQIFRPSNLVAYYKPRQELIASIKHLYERGPRFVDYYLRPGTRFFPVLVTAYLIAAGLILGAVFWPVVLAITLIGAAGLVLAVALFISRSPKELIVSIIGLPLIGLTFSLGIFKGTLLMLSAKARS